MFKYLTIVLMSAVCFSMFATEAPAAADVKLEIRLAPAVAGASGKAVYETRTTRRKVKVEGQDLGRFNGQIANVYVNNALVGTARIALGRFSVERSTEFRQVVPVVVKGSPVLVTVGATRVLSGSF